MTSKYTCTVYPTGYVMLKDGTVVRSGPIFEEFQRKYREALDRAAKETMMTTNLYNYRCLVKRVVDGDTVQAEIDLGFHLKFTSMVRMLYYDAPEIMRQHARSEAELNEGLLAKNELIGLVLDKPGVMIRTQLERSDKYGRVLGLLWVEGEPNTVNNHMLAFTNAQWLKLGGKPEVK